MFEAIIARIRRRPIASSTIELRVDEIAQLFNTLDPLPFHERDLDKAAEDFIVGWARELPLRNSIKLLIHLPKRVADRREAALLPDAIIRYFQYRAQGARLDLNELFRIGRGSLAIGFGVLSACLLVGQFISGRLGSGYVGKFVDESLVILGWVANWKPIEILLYDWLPLKRRLDLYLRLSRAEVGLMPFDTPSAAN